MHEVFKSSKGLWFPSLITKLFHMAEIDEDKIVEIMKLGLPISTRSTTETQSLPGRKNHVAIVDSTASAY